MAQKVNIRVPMPPSRRAKQFAPFDALKGFREAIAAKEVLTVPKRELSADRIEELDQQLNKLEKGQLVTVIYYGLYEKNYLQVTGTIGKIDCFWKLIQIGNIEIEFSEIYQIFLSD